MKDDKPPKVSIDGESGAGLWVLTCIACAFILGLIIGTIIWMP